MRAIRRMLASGAASTRKRERGVPGLFAAIIIQGFKMPPRHVEAADWAGTADWTPPSQQADRISEVTVPFDRFGRSLALPSIESNPTWDRCSPRIRQPLLQQQQQPEALHAVCQFQHHRTDEPIHPPTNQPTHSTQGEGQGDHSSLHPSPMARGLLAAAAALVAAAAVIRPAAAASGPLEVIDAAGRIKGKEEVANFVSRRVRGPGDRGELCSGMGLDWGSGVGPRVWTCCFGGMG